MDTLIHVGATLTVLAVVGMMWRILPRARRWWDFRGPGPLRLLEDLEREAKIWSFADMADLGGFTDEQVGAFAREMHAGLRKAVARHQTLCAALVAPEAAPGPPAAEIVRPGAGQALP